MEMLVSSELSSFVAPIATVCAGALALFGVWMGHRFSTRTAEKQWRLDQKLKIYGDVLRAISEYSVWLADVSEWRKFGQVGREQAHTLDKKNKQMAEEFHAAYAVAPLFVSQATLDLLELAKPSFYYHSDPLADFDPKEIDASFDTLQRVREEIIVSAKLDLGTSHFAK
jgi:hypothetical protein